MSINKEMSGHMKIRRDFFTVYDKLTFIFFDQTALIISKKAIHLNNFQDWNILDDCLGKQVVLHLIFHIRQMNQDHFPFRFHFRRQTMLNQRKIHSILDKGVLLDYHHLLFMVHYLFCSFFFIFSCFLFLSNLLIELILLSIKLSSSCEL